MTIEERANAYVGYPEEIDEFTSETVNYFETKDLRASYSRQFLYDL